MGNVIYYKDYIRKAREVTKGLYYNSKKYIRLNSILNRIVDWQLSDSN